jgi:Ca2+-binding EF-hand superfamily protein
MANKLELIKNKDNQPQVIEERITRLEKKLRTKFSNCFESVRKAFLALDTDYDGFITVEDILKYFGNETDLNFNDLKKLITDKDSGGLGRLNYQDFSKWLGAAIHQSEGFYFRHDSIKNPQYDRFLDDQAKNSLKDDKF